MASDIAAFTSMSSPQHASGMQFGSAGTQA
jgi:hypothetical protein